MDSRAGAAVDGVRRAGRRGEAGLLFFIAFRQHVLVVPKAPSRNLLDADPAVLAKLLPAVQRIARAVKTAFAADGVSVFQYNEAAGGQSVFHLHFHVVPRHEGVPLKPHSGQMEDGQVLAANAEKVRAALAA